MLIRKMLEESEGERLSPHACLSVKSHGRVVREEECELRTCFQRDRDRIIHSKAFRRLKHKTQVFFSPEGDHYRTRLTHTLEVSQIARTIARALRLNEDLTEAIALGHDLGHTPFGHAGEEAINEVVQGGFEHNKQSLRVVEVLEVRDQNLPGLNLTWEVRNGILTHTGPDEPGTLEGQIVRLADRIAYINHDIDDAIRGRLLSQEGLPRRCLEVLGTGHSARISTMVKDVVAMSSNQPVIRMSEAVYDAMNELRDFLFDCVYIGSTAKVEADKARQLLIDLWRFFIQHPDTLAAEADKAVNDDNCERIATDHVAGMTDRYCVYQYFRFFVPKAWPLYPDLMLYR